jgi:hypothetical protein
MKATEKLSICCPGVRKRVFTEDSKLDDSVMEFSYDGSGHIDGGAMTTGCANTPDIWAK